MIRLFKCEFKKFKATYINSLSLLGMLAPVALVMLMFLIKRHDYIKIGVYNWDKFNEYINQFFVLLVGPIITSFIAVFSVFYEYQQKTMKNVLSSPHRRLSIILTKILYSSAYVILQYTAVAIVNAACGFLLGFHMTIGSTLSNSWHMILVGMITILLIPLMMFITLLTKNFIPALIITVIGTISNVLIMNWEKSYLSPWAVPIDLFGIATKMLKMKLLYPVTSLCIYFVLFMVLTLVYFKSADQNV